MKNLAFSIESECTKSECIGLILEVILLIKGESYDTHSKIQLVKLVNDISLAQIKYAQLYVARNIHNACVMWVHNLKRANINVYSKFQITTKFAELGNGIANFSLFLRISVITINVL